MDIATLAPPRTAWPAVAAVLAGLTLLLAFQKVVAGVAEQGRLQHRATAAHVEGAWRCKLLRSSSERTDCLARVDAAYDLVSPARSRR